MYLNARRHLLPDPRSYVILDAKYQVSLKSVHWFQRRFFKVFTIYGHGGYLGHVTWTIYINFGSPFLRMLHMKFGIDWTRGFRGEDL